MAPKGYFNVRQAMYSKGLNNRLVQYQNGRKWYSDHHLNTAQVKVCYSDVSVIQMFVIQIPTVLGTKIPII